MRGWRDRRSFLSTMALALSALAACSSTGPPPKLYVLGDVASPRSDAVSQPAAVAEVKRVRLPDYLDTTDIVSRGAGGLIVTSQSGRWAERLSINVTRAFAQSLQARVPQLAVTTAPREDPRWQVVIDIDVFEVQPDGQCVLAGRWSVRDSRGGRTLKDETISLSAPVARSSDAELVAAMTRQVDELAGRVAPALETALAR